ncbi:MAG TPA: hypothetical protein VG960_02300 [Caulobacteraceae bacterium]|nr:hypothetical protein [Caulobacteraceae bacterium]
MAADILIDTPIANALALAMVEASTAPLLLLDGEFKIVAVSPTFLNAFSLPYHSATGADVFSLGSGEWNMAQLQSLLKATLDGSAQVGAYEIDLKRPGQADRRLVLNARRLDCC